MQTPRLLFGYDNEIAEWAAARIPHVGPDGFGPCRAIGIVTDDRILAGVVYTEYEPDFRTIELSAAAESPLWARRSIIGDFLAYPFLQLDCWKVWTRTPIDNEAAIKVNLKSGFTKEAVLNSHFGPGRHAVICRMLKPDYLKIYGETYGRRKRQNPVPAPAA